MNKQIISFFAILLLSASSIFSFDKAFFEAVGTNKLSRVKTMLKKSYIQINELNDENKTVLDIAVERRYNKLARYLLKQGGRVTTNTHASLLINHLSSRALGFFIAGWFFNPWLWIGTATSLSKQSLVMVLK